VTNSLFTYFQEIFDNLTKYSVISYSAELMVPAYHTYRFKIIAIFSSDCLLHAVEIAEILYNHGYGTRSFNDIIKQLHKNYRSEVVINLTSRSFPEDQNEDKVAKAIGMAINRKYRFRINEKPVKEHAYIPIHKTDKLFLHNRFR
jgi:hypothetical protein